MGPDELLSRITIDPAVCGGVRGHRIWVSLLLGMLAGGTTIDELLEDYPQLERRTFGPAWRTAPSWPRAGTWTWGEPVA